MGHGGRFLINHNYAVHSEEPLVERFRTAVRAEMAESGHALHPVICKSDTTELRVVVVACVGHGEAFCENEHSCPG